MISSRSSGVQFRSASGPIECKISCPSVVISDEPSPATSI